MSKIITLEKKISLEPQYLDSNIEQHILKKLKDVSNNECSKDYGYFLKIVKLNKIINNYISSDCQIIFNVEYEVETLKPETNKIFEGTVCMIFSGGIFLTIKNKMKVLIPISSLSDFEYKQNSNNFINKKNNKETIKENDFLKISISGIKYSKSNFSCFGTLVKN